MLDVNCLVVYLCDERKGLMRKSIWFLTKSKNDEEIKSKVTALRFDLIFRF
jgi:hypothetical protein